MATKKSSGAKSAKKKAPAKQKTATTKKKAAKKAPAKKKAAKKAPTSKKAAPKAATPGKSTEKKMAKKALGKKKGAARPKAATASSAPPADAPVLATPEEFGLVPERDRTLPPIKIPKRELTDLEKRLRLIRAQLTQDVDSLTQNNLSHSGRDMSGDLSGYGFHMADVATDNFAREMELNIATGETDRLRLVEEAMDRFRDGTFGRCLECGEPVGIPRLKVIPYARFCIACAEEVERG